METEKLRLILPFTPIGHAPNCRGQLKEIQQELTPEWVEHYDQTAWRDYHDCNHRMMVLPELGEPGMRRHYRDHRDLRDIVIPIKHRRFKINLVWPDWDDGEPWEADNKSIVMEETDEPETPFTLESVWPVPGDWPGTQIRPSGSFCFGQPYWIQGGHYPADKHGRPCYHLLTYANDWGDSGNWNILVGLDLNDIPEIAYFEASCC